MKTQEKELRRHQIIRFYGYTYHACFNRDSHISTIAATNTEHHRRCHLRDMRCCHVTRIYDHPAKQFARIDFFSADMPERSLVTVSIG